jgi:hypothetical protein
MTSRRSSGGGYNVEEGGGGGGGERESEILGVCFFLIGEKKKPDSGNDGDNNCRGDRDHVS